MTNITETISEVQKLNPELARQITKFVKDHSYGLVFERNLPEAVRLYTKKPAIGDTVNIRPARGFRESDENKVPWVVKDIKNDQATIERDGEVKSIFVGDIVTLVSYKDTIYPGLKEIDRIERGNPDDPYHMVINSENYHALEALTYAYAGKVDCIYIDPPYNTGANDWKYNNDYVDPTDKYSHSKWLAFIERRLLLAAKLLNPDNSTLIITIDEKEYLRLGLLLEQMFPEANIQMICSKIKSGTSMRLYEFSRCNEYIYYVRFGTAVIGKEVPNENSSSIPWRPLMRSGTGKNNFRIARPNSFYPIFVDSETKEVKSVGAPLLPIDTHPSDDLNMEGCVSIYPIDSEGRERVWGLSAESLKEYLKKNYAKIVPKRDGFGIQYITTGVIDDINAGKLIVTGHDDNGGISGYYVSGKAQMPLNQWDIPTHNATTYGTNLLKSIVGNRFPYPKSLYAVRDCLRHVIRDNKNALIIDFFSGSGTTLHAVNLMNAEDGGHRICICVTNNEVAAEEQDSFIKKGLRPGDDEWEQYGIARYVTWSRTKCSIAGIDINGNPIEGKYIDSNIPMSEGFKANAIFCELTYESVWNIRLDQAFDAIAPILWMLSGCKGEIIRRLGKSYLTTDYYGVLFDYGQASKFCQKVKSTPSIKTVFVVTDDQRRYSNVCKRLPNVEVHRLYESFLKTFEICGEGGLDI